jgi:RimJ/RimL family protein N-acetyltransferase
MCIKIKDKPLLHTHYSKSNDMEIYFYFVGPECAQCLKRGLRALSYKSRKQRFNTPIKKFSKNMLNYLTNIDNEDHIGIIAETRKKRMTLGLGVCRCKRIPEYPDTAELAVTIVDKYQNMGIGTMLTKLLSKIAREKDITKFHAHVNKDNIPMIKLIEKFSSTIIRSNYNEILYEIDLCNTE